ncbi:MAG TPA: hypothetical protein VMH28_09945 [Candidatus Acidoferrales bacterium]|nr:hypothetical protein [Candidatus Acidoferrales bacterium]
MYRIALPVFLAALAGAQDNPFNRPPAAVDSALRERIREFYDLHVQGKFRQADDLVAEDSKDYYFNSAKPKYLSYEIARIDYSDEFTRAKAVIMCEMYIMMPGFNDKPVKMPTPSAWKLVDGKWYWYVDQAALRNSPFGRMTPGPAAASGQSNMPSATTPPVVNMSPEFLFKQIQVNKKEVSLSPGESVEILVANSAPGAMGVSVRAAPAGVEANLDKNSIGANQNSVLTIRAAKDFKPGLIDLEVQQTGQIISIQVKQK